MESCGGEATAGAERDCRRAAMDLTWRARSRMQHGKNGRPRGQLTYAWPLRRQPGERVDAARYARTLALAFAFYPPWQQIFGEEDAGGADAEWALRCGVAMATSSSLSVMNIFFHSGSSSSFSDGQRQR